MGRSPDPADAQTLDTHLSAQLQTESLLALAALVIALAAIGMSGHFATSSSTRALAPSVT